MLEIILSIILLPVAILAAAFTIALGAGVIKYTKNKKKDGSKGSDKS